MSIQVTNYYDNCDETQNYAILKNRTIEVNTDVLGYDYIQLASTYKHLLALKTDGSVVVDGVDTKLQIPNKDFIQIGCTYDYFVGLRKNNTIVKWDRDTYEIINCDEHITRLICGYGHIIALSFQTIVLFDTASSITIPKEDLDAEYIDVSIGYNCIAGLKNDGTVVTWSNGYFRDKCTEQQPDYDDFIQVSCGQDHVVGLRAGGTIVRWGCINKRYSNPEDATTNGVVTRIGYDTYDIPVDFVQVAATAGMTVGLQRDGCLKVISEGQRKSTSTPNGKCLQLYTGIECVLCLMSDGKIVAI